MKYKIWDKESNLVTPTLKVKTPEQIFEEYPASELEGFKFIVCDNPVSMGVFMEFESTKAHYAQLGVVFTEEMTDQEVLDAITTFEETTQTTTSDPLDRIASTLEFQTMMALPDVEIEPEVE